MTNKHRDTFSTALQVDLPLKWNYWHRRLIGSNRAADRTLTIVFVVPSTA